jgi:tetratricopeptide (TPR) repeat protein
MGTLVPVETNFEKIEYPPGGSTMRVKLMLFIAILTAGLSSAQDRLADQLRKAIVEEESYQNLDKAIQAYQSILAQYDEERRTAATALFHLADCYRKLGKTDQAVSAYQRVVREFPDQTKLAEASRNYLPKGFTAVQDKREAYDRRTFEARQRYRLLLEEEIRLIEVQIVGMQKRVEIGLVSPNGTEMTSLKTKLLELQRSLAAFDAGAWPIPQTIIK